MSQRQVDRWYVAPIARKQMWQKKNELSSWNKLGVGWFTGWAGLNEAL